MKRAASFAASVVFACGARTGLESDVCFTPGETRQCEVFCGIGTQTCERGAWSRCDVPVATRPCENDCGTGFVTCAGDAWSECEVPSVTRACSSVCGQGDEVCVDGEWRACNAPAPLPPKLVATVRDFHASHPDFERPTAGVDPGIVAFNLGGDDKPVYAKTGGTRTTTDAASFDQWYRDVPGVNGSTQLTLELERSPEDSRLFVFVDDEFFPIDGQLFGNEGNDHNFHFTLEARGEMKYVGGEVFNFAGDDDVWVFINRRLAIDLGGLHNKLAGSVDLDEMAARLEIQVGGVYPIHLFFAERHTVESTFEIETSVAGERDCP